MYPSPRTRASRSIFSTFAVQAAITALFGLLNANVAHGPAYRNIVIAAAVMCLGVGPAQLAIVGHVDGRCMF